MILTTFKIRKATGFYSKKKELIQRNTLSLLKVKIFIKTLSLHWRRFHTYFGTSL